MENVRLKIVDGLKFVKDKNTGYYLNRKNQIRLHRYIYEKYNGKIEHGICVHHKDFNRDNNKIENLQAVESKKHLSLHGKNITEERKQQLRKNLIEKAIPKAAEWHKSEKGRKWHKTHYDNYKHLLHKKATRECNNCGKIYKTVDTKKVKFCSNACKSAHRRNIGVDDIKKICPICKNEFKRNKYAKNITCSKKCGGKLRSSKINKKNSTKKGCI